MRLLQSFIQNVCGADDRGVLAMQVAQRHRMDLFSAVGITEKVGLVEGKAGILRDPGVKPQIACGARRGFHRVVRRYADDDQLLDPRLT